jgi:hypothetical protein
VAEKKSAWLHSVASAVTRAASVASLLFRTGNLQRTVDQNVQHL